MKKFKIFNIALIVLFINQSCSEYLDVVPDDTPTIDIAFENRNSAETYLATVYNKIPRAGDTRNPALFGGDELWVNQAAQQSDLGGFAPLEIAQGNQSEGRAILNYMNGDGNLYIGIRNANTLLEKIHIPYDMSQQEKDQWAAEAKVLKAYYHYYLMRMYGPIEVVKENLPVSVDAETARGERIAVDEVVEYIISLIDESLEFLPTEDTGTIEVGRITRVVAASIKAKVLMTAASPLFNGNSDYPSLINSKGEELINSTFDSEKWVKAELAVREALVLAQTEGFSLYEFPLDRIGADDLSELTQLKLSIRGSVTEPSDNFEVIWKATASRNFSQSRYFAKMNDPLSLITQFSHTSIQSYYSPPLRIAEMFYTENGLPIDQDATYNYGERYNLRTSDVSTSLNIRTNYTTANLHYSREPRFYASIAFDGGTWFGHSRTDETNTWISELKGGQAGGFTGDSDDNTWSATGYLPKKMVHYESSHRANSAAFSQVGYPMPLIRLADLYLLHAEAINEVSGPSTEVYELMNVVRTRAGIPDVQTSYMNFALDPNQIFDQDALRKIIHQERMIELVFEGQRFWDLRRWKRAEEFMGNELVKGWTVSSGSTGGFYNVKTIFQQSFDKKDYLWPIPLDNILNNPNLIQNPGW